MHWWGGRHDRQQQQQQQKIYGKKGSYGQKLKLCVDANMSAKPLMSIAWTW